MVIIVLAFDDDLEIDYLRMEAGCGVVEADFVVPRGVDRLAVRVVGFSELADEGDAVWSQNSAGKVNNS